MKKPLLIAPFLLVAAALALSACGGGGSSTSGGGEEAAIEKAVETSATTSKPSNCTDLQTRAFNEQGTGASGSKATELCEEQLEEPQDPAESADVSNIAVEGETATADAALQGGTLNGQTVELEMAKEEGAWKLNQMLGLAKYDAKALGEGTAAAFEKQGELSASAIKCFAEGFGGLTQAEAEEVLLEGKYDSLEEFGCE